MIAALYVGCVLIPDRHAGYFTVDLNGHRGIYNSAWVSGVAVLAFAYILMLFGIFPIRNAIANDVTFGTDELVAASAISRFSFILGKWLSNVALLGSGAAVLFFGATVMQLLRGEDRHIAAGQFVLSFCLLLVPPCCLLAAIAILFECVGFLRGIFGSVVFVVTFPILALVLSQAAIPGTAYTFDPAGMSTVLNSMTAAASNQLHIPRVGESFIDPKPPDRIVPTFVWPGVDWTPALVAIRLAWIAVAAIVAALSSLIFDRFRHQTRRVQRSGRAWRISNVIPALWSSGFTIELLVLINGLSFWWWAWAAMGVVVSMTASQDSIRHFILPLIALLPLVRWSILGTRDIRCSTQEMLAALPVSRTRRLLRQWGAGVLFAVTPWSGFLIRELFGGALLSVAATLALLAAMTALALLLGEMTRSQRAFEAVFLLTWFLGPMNHVACLDFVGALFDAPAALLTVSFALALVAISLGVSIDGVRHRFAND
jgi:ABC-type transport system involved in multi-copper enzyme maturation permease subunit